MNKEIKQIFVDRQAKIRQEYEKWESIQTDYSYDIDFYKFCQWKMDSLNKESDKIRWKLEGVDDDF